MGAAACGGGGGSREGQGEVARGQSKLHKLRFRRFLVFLRESCTDNVQSTGPTTHKRRSQALEPKVYKSRSQTNAPSRTRGYHCRCLWPGRTRGGHAPFTAVCTRWGQQWQGVTIASACARTPPPSLRQCDGPMPHLQVPVPWNGGREAPVWAPRHARHLVVLLVQFGVQSGCVSAYGSGVWVVCGAACGRDNSAVANQI